MRALVIFLPFALAPAGAFAADACNPANAESVIRDGEFEWAQSVVTGDTSVPQRILADDFVGVSPMGTLYDKAREVEAAPGSPRDFISNVLDQVTIRFYGNTAVAQGSESWVRTDGTRGTYVWTDTWVCRGGEWRIVAAEDVVKARPGH